MAIRTIVPTLTVCILRVPLILGPVCLSLHHKEVTMRSLIIFFFLPSITHLLPHSSQDAHTFVPDFDKDTALLAVFDGHGGERGNYIDISTSTVTY